MAALFFAHAARMMWHPWVLAVAGNEEWMVKHLEQK
jgi:hypothetical protein